MLNGPERPREAPHVNTLFELTSYLSTFVKAQERKGAPTQAVLVTYNRVGEGFLEPRTIKGGLTLDVYSSPALAIAEVDRFYAGVKTELSRLILKLEVPTFFVVYAGEVEKFQSSLDLIEKLSFLAGAVGKRDLVKFYLLTCNCGIEEKVKMVEPLCEGQLLRHLVYNPDGACGGTEAMQAIVDSLTSQPSQRKSVAFWGDFDIVGGMKGGAGVK